MTMKTYFTVTTIIIVQKISETTPKMWSAVDRQRVRADEHLLHRIERAGADVAEHDADRADGELAETVVAMP